MDCVAQRVRQYTVIDYLLRTHAPKWSNHAQRWQYPQSWPRILKFRGQAQGQVRPSSLAPSHAVRTRQRGRTHNRSTATPLSLTCEQRVSPIVSRPLPGRLAGQHAPCGSPLRPGAGAFVQEAYADACG